MQQQQPFQIGDVVKLKSGSPKMTVVYIDRGDGKVWCKWFVIGAANEVPKEDSFPPGALER